MTLPPAGRRPPLAPLHVLIRARKLLCCVVAHSGFPKLVSAVIAGRPDAVTPSWFAHGSGEGVASASPLAGADVSSPHGGDTVDAKMLATLVDLCVETVHTVRARRIRELQALEADAVKALEDSMKSLWEAVRAQAKGKDRHDAPRPGSPLASGASSRKRRQEDDTVSHTDAVETRRGTKLPQRISHLLTEWFLGHQDHPFPSPEERAHLCAATGLTECQVRNWCVCHLLPIPLRHCDVAVCLAMISLLCPGSPTCASGTGRLCGREGSPSPSWITHCSISQRQRPSQPRPAPDLLRCTVTHKTSPREPHTARASQKMTLSWLEDSP